MQQSGFSLQRGAISDEVPVTEVPCLRLAADLAHNPESLRRSRRLEVLRDQFRQANRRAAGPFSHPFATRGSLAKLREQIRDVSRIIDAVLLNTESASDQRFGDLCGDLGGLLQTQQRWTDRLENQIWRLESQSSLLQRLRQVLVEQPPSDKELWSLCEVVARDTQALPTGLLLLPEPGHGLLLPTDDVPARCAAAIEQARLAVFTAMKLLPDVRGAEIVAQTLHAASSNLLRLAGQDHDSSVFAQSQWRQRAPIANPTGEMLKLIKVAGHFLTVAESFSKSTVDHIAPPAIPDFFGGLHEVIERNPEVSEPDIKMAHAVCEALGLADARAGTSRIDDASNHDAAIVLTHKLRWHDAESSDDKSARASRPAHARRPHFSTKGLSTTTLTVFARED